jgi:branched-chain amino acid transport system permease protein
MVLIILVLGGAGRLYGGMVGAVVYMILRDLLADLSPEYWMFWIGLFLMFIVMVGSGGILGGLSRLVRVEKP